MLIALALALAHLASEGAWRLLLETGDESTYYNTVDLSRQGSQTLVWVKHELNQPLSNGGLRRDDLLQIDCEARTFSLISYTIYDVHGVRDIERTIAPDSRRANSILPNSRMAVLASAVCDASDIS